MLNVDRLILLDVPTVLFAITILYFMLLFVYNKHENLLLFFVLLVLCHLFFCRYMYGETFSPETSWSGNQTVHVIFDKIPDSLALSGGQKSTNWIFLASMHSNPQAATKAYITGEQI